MHIIRYRSCIFLYLSVCALYLYTRLNLRDQRKLSPSSLFDSANLTNEFKSDSEVMSYYSRLINTLCFQKGALDLASLLPGAPSLG